MFRLSRVIITDATRESLYTVLHTKVSRLLILELNAARVTGRLSGETSEQRWQQFLELSSEQSFWEGLTAHYSSLLSRVDALVRKRCLATLLFAQRWTTDRRWLECEFGVAGELSELNFGRQLLI